MISTYDQPREGQEEGHHLQSSSETAGPIQPLVLLGSRHCASSGKHVNTYTNQEQCCLNHPTTQLSKA